MWDIPADIYTCATDAHANPTYTSATHIYTCTTDTHANPSYAGTTHIYTCTTDTHANPTYAGTTHAYSGAYCHTHGIPEPRPSGVYLDGLRCRVRPGHLVWRPNRGL